MNDRPIVREQSGRVAVLHMVHGRVNALDLRLCEALVDAFADVELGSAEAVVLTGSGSTFSAGVDLRRLLAGGPDYVRTFLPVLRRMFEAVALSPRPVVAAVNGHAIAGGFVLLAAADQAIAASGAGRAGVTELLVGLPFPTVALELVRLRAGMPLAARMAYTGATYPPAETRALGLVDELAEPERLLERAIELAGALAAAGPAFRLTKELLRRPLRDALAGDAAYEAAVDEFWRQEPALAAVRRYAEAVLDRRR
jgi:enoyl-CoA hydratase